MLQEFCLDGWLVRPQLHLLVGPDGEHRVEGHSMEVLVALAERPGEVVSRRELLDRVWSGLFVGEEVLSHAVWDLRRALGDDSKHPRFIETHRKMGYRLLAGVGRRPREPRNTGLGWLLGGVLLALFAATLWSRWMRPVRRPQ